MCSLVLSHRQQFRDKEPVSHPKETHRLAERVCWGLTAVCRLLRISLSVLQRHVHCWKGPVRGQGRYRGRRRQRGEWRRWWWGGAGWGRGAVPLRGQGGRWLQHVVRTSQWISWSCRTGGLGAEFIHPQLSFVVRSPPSQKESRGTRWLTIWVKELITPHEAVSQEYTADRAGSF